MNANETSNAISNLSYPATATSDELDIYYAQVDVIVDKFRKSLIEKHASNLPKGVQDAIWSKSFSDGHDLGYSDIAFHYEGLADFARSVRSIN